MQKRHKYAYAGTVEGFLKWGEKQIKKSKKKKRRKSLIEKIAEEQRG